MHTWESDTHLLRTLTTRRAEGWQEGDDLLTSSDGGDGSREEKKKKNAAQEMKLAI